MQNNIWDDKNLIKILENDGVVVMPTDTIYGLVGKALQKEVVERIYEIKKRTPEKPFIILIGDLEEIKKLEIELIPEQKKNLEKFWPGSVSIILNCSSEDFSFLHRGTKVLALRLPLESSLRDLLIKTGPLIATSANTEALPPCKNIEEAKEYFGNSVDLYVDGGLIKEKHSKLIKLNKDGSIIVLRE